MKTALLSLIALVTLSVNVQAQPFDFSEWKYSDSTLIIAPVSWQAVGADGAPDAHAGSGTSLFFMGQAKIGSPALKGKVVHSECIAENWIVDGEQWGIGLVPFTSTCGDSTQSGSFVSVPVGENEFDGSFLPIEIFVHMAPGAKIYTFNGWSVRDEPGWEVTRYYQRSTVDRFLRRVEEISDTLSTRAVVWIETFEFDQYYDWEADYVQMPRNEFPSGSEECRAWAPEITARIERLHDGGVVIAAWSGWSVNKGVDDMQRYPACLEEVMAVTRGNPDDYLHQISSYDNGADIAGPSYVWFLEGPSIEHSSPSTAVAVIAATASRILSRYPTLSPFHVERAIKEGGVPVRVHLGFAPSFVQMDKAEEAAATMVGVEEEIPLDRPSVLQVYPNPYRAGDVLNIEMEEMLPYAPKKVVVYDLLGREVSRLRAGEATSLHLPSGVYVLYHSTSGTTTLLTVVN